MKDFLRRWLNVEPEIVYRDVDVIKEVEVEILPSKMGEILDEFQETLYGRNVVLQLSDREADDYQRGRIKGQIEMLSKIMLRFAGEKNEDS